MSSQLSPGQQFLGHLDPLPDPQNIPDHIGLVDRWQSSQEEAAVGAAVQGDLGEGGQRIPTQAPLPYGRQLEHHQLPTGVVAPC